MDNMKMNHPDGPKIVHGLYPSGSSALPPGPGMISEVSGIGMMSIFWNPGSISTINLTKENPADFLTGKIYETQAKDLKNDTMPFKDFSELHPTVRFLICCGPLPQLEIARQCVLDAIRFCGGKINELRVPNLGFTALEWAAKKGNLDIVKWLCTDERTRELIHLGCPIGWAGYTGQVEIMRLLVSYGADPANTDAILWGGVPPLFVAAQNGQLDALKFFVDECNQDIGMLDRHGKNILKHVTGATNWRECPGHVACHKWAKKLLQKKKKKSAKK